MNIQFKKGVLELCVLSLLGKTDRYGYDIAAAFSDKIGISDGTVYPVLRRLMGDAYLSSYLQESNEGPPRKYYTITNKGRVFRAELYDEWVRLTGEVNKLAEEGVSA